MDTLTDETEVNTQLGQPLVFGNTETLKTSDVNLANAESERASKPPSLEAEHVLEASSQKAEHVSESEPQEPEKISTLAQDESIDNDNILRSSSTKSSTEKPKNLVDVSYRNTIDEHDEVVKNIPRSLTNLDDIASQETKQALQKSEHDLESEQEEPERPSQTAKDESINNINLLRSSRTTKESNSTNTEKAENVVDVSYNIHEYNEFVENIPMRDYQTSRGAKNIDETVPMKGCNSDMESPNSSVILSPRKLENVARKRVLQTSTDIESHRATLETREDAEEQKVHKKPHYERRKIFNIAKHVVSIVCIVLDLIFDWVEYTEMNKRGNYSIVAERRVKKIEFTFECQGTGEHIQFIFLIFTIVSTVLTVLQILNIIYQVFYEMKGVYEGKKIFNETVETFVFLLFIETSQMLLIMGFYDVCTLDCIINVEKIRLVLNGMFSILKISWRFVTQWRCCTLRWVTPSVPKREQSAVTRIVSRPRQRTAATTKCCGDHDICHNPNAKFCLIILFFPLLLPLLPCILIWMIYQSCCKEDSTVSEESSSWKCEQSFKCCILRCFPSRFDDEDTNTCDCTCKKCLSCERVCKCFTMRCFPTYLDQPKNDIFECTCGRCMRCEKMCGCCILRCCPSYLNPPQHDICTCRCAECLAFELPCKCFIFRCFPEYLDTPHPDICTCRCAECLAFELPCKCFIFRCFPEYLDTPHPDICTCKCAECLAFELPCKCFIFRCFPEYLDTPHTDICTCRCAECMAFELPCKCFVFRCCPEYLDTPKSDICTCKCAECLSCELPCKCFAIRLFPQYLNPAKSKWLECMCGECMKCERTCCCCILRCFPSLLGEDDFCTCIFRECTACEKNFACFICRCFPTVLDPTKSEVFECTCGKCLSCEQNVCCCRLRCCPVYLDPAKDDWCECLCCKNKIGPTLARTPSPTLIPLQPSQTPTLPLRIDTPSLNKRCCCFCGIPTQPSLPTLVMSQTTPGPPIPSRIPTPSLDTCSCCLCCISTPLPLPTPVISQPTPGPQRIATPPLQRQTLVISQPRMPIIFQPTPGPSVPAPMPPQIIVKREPVCKTFCSTIVRLLLAVLIILIILLIIFYSFLEVVQVRYVLVCFVNDTLMNATQVLIVQNYLKLFQL